MSNIAWYPDLSFPLCGFFIIHVNNPFIIQFYEIIYGKLKNRPCSGPCDRKDLKGKPDIFR